jgi:acyl-CoA reductase-like NAD-dependent aldehyde dehydrogenase
MGVDSPLPTSLADTPCLAHRCPSERVSLIHSLAELLTLRAESIGKMIALQTGKPIRFSISEVQRTVGMMRAVASRFLADREEEPFGSARLRRRPVGRIAVITPANNPVYIPFSKLIPAMVYGNQVVWKPAEEVTELSSHLVDCLSEAHWPAEIVRCRKGGREVAQQLMRDPGIQGVTLTGSEEAGRVARHICAERNVPLQAELGGNNAAIIWADVAMESAVQAVAAGAFEMAGQRCTANRRVIVHRDVRDAFVDGLVVAARHIRWGDPLSSDTQMGPLLTPSRCERVAGCVERASKQSSIHYPQGVDSPVLRGFRGCWFPPTIVLCDDDQAEIVQEETFGPILVVQTASNWDQAIRLLNGVRQGLVAALFSSSVEIRNRFLDEAEAGILKLNRATADAEIDVPFCAWKASGTGLPEHGIFNREFYTRPQTVYEAA